ncbi:MAG: ADP-ribosylglycohydrolase family protein, partial [Ktedonobacterales bacterium]
NGAAMRVAPLGAYFADDLDRVVEQATRSAEATHAHAEGIAGAIAVAVAAAQAARLHDSQLIPRGADFLDLVLPYVPESEVRAGIEQARKVRATARITNVVKRLGNGAHISAQDTVPFTLWCAAQHLNDYEAALWLTVSGLRDRDTTCAIVGGIVAAHVGIEGIPVEWRARREPLPAIQGMS